MIAAIDAYGGVRLTPTISPATWTKNGVPFAPVSLGGGVYQDNCPQRNYVHVDSNALNFSFTGNELAIYADTGTRYEEGGIYPYSQKITVTIDGVVQGYDYSAFDYMIRNVPAGQLVWGTTGLTNELHSVVIADTGLGAHKIAHASSNFSAEFGEEITYVCTAAGGATESVTVSPAPSRPAVVRDALSVRVLPAFSDYPANITSHGLDVGADLCVLATFYRLTSDPRILSYLPAIYSALDAQFSTYPATATAHFPRARAAQNLIYAYRVFGDIAYLTLACTIVKQFRDDWPKFSSTWTGSTLTGIWGSSSNAAGLPARDATAFNQWTDVICACLQIHQEPDVAGVVGYSDLYLDATLLGIIQNNWEWTIKGHIDYNESTLAGTGAIYYLSAPHTQTEFSYALFEYPALKWVASVLGTHQSSVDKAEQWIATRYGIEGPFTFLSEDYYGYAPCSTIAVALAYSARYGLTADLASFITRHYSRQIDAFGMNEGGDEYLPEYNPLGWTTFGAVSQLDVYNTIFSFAHQFELLGWPIEVWAYDPTTLGTLFTDAAGNQSPVSDSTGNPMTFYGGDGNPL